MVARMLFRAPDGCCICGTKSSSSRFTHSDRYSRHFAACFGPEAATRCGLLCNACVLQIKRCLKRAPRPADTATGRWEATHVLDCRRCPGTRNVRSTARLRRRQSADEEDEEFTMSYRQQRQREREEFKHSSSSTDENSKSPLKPYSSYERQAASHSPLFHLSPFFLPSSTAPSVSSSPTSSVSSQSQGSSPFEGKQNHLIGIDDQQSLRVWEKPVRRGRKILSPVKSPSEGEMLGLMQEIRQRDDQEYFVDMRVVHMLLQQQMRRAKKLSIGMETEN